VRETDFGDLHAVARSKALRPLQSLVTLLSVISFAATTACSPTSPPPPGAASESTLHGFAAPADWAFPPDRITPTHGSGGMVSTTDRVTSEIGIELLRRGGSAVDAAIGIHFALAVVNPEAGNLGGGGFIGRSDGRWPDRGT
jgi:gamma-glutamyltranspeptidase/glutathione hydrolase